MRSVLYLLSAVLSGGVHLTRWVSHGPTHGVHMAINSHAPRATAKRRALDSDADALPVPPVISVQSVVNISTLYTNGVPLPLSEEGAAAILQEWDANAKAPSKPRDELARLVLLRHGRALTAFHKAKATRDDRILAAVTRTKPVTWREVAAKIGCSERFIAYWRHRTLPVLTCPTELRQIVHRCLNSKGSVRKAEAMGLHLKVAEAFDESGDVEAAARAAGCDKKTARDMLRLTKRAHLENFDKPLAVAIPDSQIVATLRQAAGWAANRPGRSAAEVKEADGTLRLSVREYARFLTAQAEQQQHQQPAESHQHPAASTILARFSSWSAACRAAGISPGRTRCSVKLGFGTQRFSEVELLDAVRDYVRHADASGRRATHVGYMHWQQEQSDGRPSIATIRNRLQRSKGNKWSTLIKKVRAHPFAPDTPA